MSERVITIEEQSQLIERRRAALRLTLNVPQNVGAFRSSEKRALLKALADEARERGQPVRFPAKY